MPYDDVVPESFLNARRRNKGMSRYTANNPPPVTFVILEHGEALEATISTSESILRTRRNWYREDADCEIVCVGEISDTAALKEYASNHHFNPSRDGGNGIYSVQSGVLTS